MRTGRRHPDGRPSPTPARASTPAAPHRAVLLAYREAFYPLFALLGGTCLILLIIYKSKENK